MGNELRSESGRLSLNLLKDYFEINRSKWSKTQKRLIESITEETSDTDIEEIYTDLYDDLPISKKKKSKKVEKTPEEIEALQREQQKLRYEKIMNDMYVINEKEDVEVESSTEMFDLLTPEERKAFNMALMKYKKKVVNICYSKLLSKRGNKKVNSDYTPLEGSRLRTDADVCDKKRNGHTGESVSVEFSNKPVSDYKVIEMNKIKGWGVNLEKDEAAIWDTSGVEQQVKFKRGYVDRKYPLNSIREGGCPCSIEFDRQKHIYKMNGDSVYEKIEKDWGCIPCNMPVDSGGVCKRHGKSEKHYSFWERDELKIDDSDIVHWAYLALTPQMNLRTWRRDD